MRRRDVQAPRQVPTAYALIAYAPTAYALIAYAPTAYALIAYAPTAPSPANSSITESS
ncbi:hypothetical protein [Streptomyces sp. NPDC093149]|uniref:hypothetical protein n=1 Tax=Streptomyces sp. NPDC093149 TaxID=3366031 RepID=UPI0037F43356